MVLLQMASQNKGTSNKTVKLRGHDCCRRLSKQGNSEDVTAADGCQIGEQTIKTMNCDGMSATDNLSKQGPLT